MGVSWGGRIQRLPLDEGGEKKEPGEEGLAFYKGTSACSGEDVRVLATMEMCSILAASDDF